jgi:NADH:ubiquinone oxidoreductase subunit E
MNSSAIPSDSDPIEIVVCYGTSCFARGNSDNLAILNSYSQSAGSNMSVRLTGKLCQEQCKEGPNLMIAGKLHHGVTTTRLRELLQQLGARLEGNHGTA